MSATSADLGSLLAVKADIAEATRQQIFWSNKYEANQKRLNKQVKYEEKWCSEFDKAKDETRSSELKINGETVCGKETAADDALAERYADFKVDEYDEELSLELAELDIEYDTMKCMFDTNLETLRAQEESLKTLVSTDAQDTCIISGG